MTEENTTEQENTSFADMLAQQEEEHAGIRLEPGQRVKVTVVAVTANTVFVSTGSKVDGIVDKAELEQDGVSEVKVGDELDLYVVHVSAQEVRLSKVIRGAGNLSALEDAKAAGLPVEGKVTAVVKGGFSIEIMRRRAFCPTSQIDIRPAEKPEDFVGKTFYFIITKLEQGGRNIVVSRRALLEVAQAENLQSFLDSVKEGDVLEGNVQRLTPFGAFVELTPGVDGLVHVSELSWSKVQKPDEMLSIGETVRVKYLGAKKEEKGGTRISLSIRQVSEDPWNNVAERLNVGDVVSGKVVRLADFGAFVEVLPGIEGLVHLSEMSWEKRVNKADEILSVSETVSVKVKEVDAEKRRVSLSLRDAAGDPWGEVEADFPIDSEHTGRLEKRAAFGLFINLAPGITGLMPNSFIASTKGKSKFDKLATGAEVTVRIAEMNLSARKLTLAPAGEDAEVVESPQSTRPAGDGQRKGGKGRAPRREDAGERDWKQHNAKPESGFGTLGAALAQAMQKKPK